MESAEAKVWPWGKVAAVAVGLFLAQLVTLHFLTCGSGLAPRTADHRTAFHFGTSPRAVGAVALIEDPTVFALPHPKGFSGPAWFGIAETKHSLAEIRSLPKFLEITDGIAFDPALRAATLERASAFELARPVAPATPLELPPTAPTQSIMRVEGELASRPLLRSAPLPVQHHTDILSNSVVQVGVDDRGFPIHVRLLGSSGLRSTDLTALQHAAETRFSPTGAVKRSATLDPTPLPSFTATPGELAWGQLVYRWLTLEPPTTNAPGVK
ncbi:MAG TPA: hypothetical protein VEH27_09020 [Methylomirabilota bacterium]|nr:hypothetical protein [Methylomirabilota bacterium]